MEASKVCTTCKAEKPLADFSKTSRSSDGLQYSCKPCCNARSIQNYNENKARYKAQARKRDNEFRDKLRLLKAKPCMDCNTSYPWYVMDFDHIKGIKVASVSQLMRDRVAWSVVLEEIEKCELVCSNCHRERTYMRSAEKDSLC